MKARVREVLFALAAGPPRVCSVRLGRGDKSGCARHRHDVRLCEQVMGCPPKGPPQGVPGYAGGILLPPGHSRQPGGKARPTRCSYHHRDGASGSAKGSIRKAQLGHALYIYMANKITIVKIKKIQRQGCGFHPWAAALMAPAQALPPPVAAPGEPVPAGTPEQGGVPASPWASAPPLLRGEGFPVIPISSGLAPGEVWGLAGLSRGSCLPTPPGTAPSPPASPAAPAPGTSRRRPACPPPRSSC